MEINEQGLRRRIGSDYLMGCYTIKQDGTTCFTDIRGGEGDVVKNPLNEEDDLTISYAGNLTEGQFYSFKWRLDDSKSVILVSGTPEPIDNKAFLEGLFNARLRLSGSNLETFNNFQKTIFNEVTGAQHTYIYELLQNANDYPHNNEHVAVKFILTDHYLFFLHSGACFNLRNIVGISTVNQGEKKKNTETIGYKGIGFKTVFVNNDYVYLKSGEWSLRFDKHYSENEFAGECPWALMPIPTSDSELDEEINETLEANLMRVQFALRHKSDASKNIEQLDKVFSDNQILLFIPHVYKVDVIVQGNLRHSVEKDENKWVVSDYKYPIPAELREWVKENISKGDKIPEKFKDIEDVRISFAVGRENNTLVAIDNARVYNYLPTELRLGFKFLFNADFVPNGSRSGLHDVEWNDRIMEQCGQQFADWWVSFLVNEGEYDMESVFNLLPDFNTRDRYAILFLKGFSQRITQIPCIPSLRDGYHLAKLKDVIFDKIDFVACKNPVLTDEELYEFSDSPGSLPHPLIRTNSNLIELLKHFNLSIEFNNNQLTQLCLEKDFCEWLTNKSNNLKFISYLLRNDYIMNYWGYKIFLKEDGSLDRAEYIYYDIDSFIDDIKFLSNDLPRLNTEIRDQLARDFNSWAGYSTRFRKFNEFEFTRKVFDDFSKYIHLFKKLENSINFIHFLAVNNSVHQIPSNYPYFDLEENIINEVESLFLINEEGKELSERNWINKSWINFLHENYLTRDEETVRTFLEKKCQINALSTSDCYRLFIAKEDRVPAISEQIKDKVNNIDFYHYLSKIQDAIGNLTPLMRQSYVVLTTDGRTEQWHPITKTIFWEDSDWEAVSKASWMPNNCCLAISDIYFKEISKAASDKLRELFSLKQIVQRFSVAGLYQSIRSNIKEVFAQITSKEISYDFLNWIFLNRSQIFKDGNIDPQFKAIPILCKDSNVMQTIESLGGRVYLPNPEALELYNQPWFNSSDIVICDEYYTSLFDGSERCAFFVSLGMKQFEKIHYLRAHLLRHLDRIKNNLTDRANNISFHRYLADIHENISEKDLEVVKSMPVYISSPNEEGGVLTPNCDNHYLPSDLLSDIISKDLVPTTILDSIHPHYILSEKDKKYFIGLGNVEINEEGFYNYIIQDEVCQEVIDYLKNRERNIKFWRWVCESKGSKEKKSELNNLPMLYRVDEGFAEGFDSPAKLFVSDFYLGTDGLEKFISENVDSPKFVSEAYKEEDDSRDWMSLFKTLKVTIEYREIVFRNVLPHLEKYKDTKIIGILARYSDAIRQKIINEDADTIKYLNNLYLKCNDGIYRTPKDIVVSGRYFDVAMNPFPDVEINNLISEEYILEDQLDDNLRRNIIKLIVAIADHYDVKCENATQLRDLKLKYFSKHQDYYSQTDAHYRIIGELASAYNNDSVGISELISNLGSIKLYTTTGKFINSLGQYLSTIYNPRCQFMANGITELDFVSEKYEEYNPNGLRYLFTTCFNIHEDFTANNLRLLQNKKFAIYFWNEYSRDKIYLKQILTEDNLRSIACIPTSSGMKKPTEVYDYRNPQLQKIVLKLKDGEQKLPGIELPSWLDRIGLRSKLYLLDCLEYLRLDTHDFRRDVITWFVDTKVETLNRFKKEINDYRESANWFNGAKIWVPLSTLVALEWGNDTLKGNFGGNAYVCNPSYMPETQAEYNKLCDILNIKILTNADFKKQKVGTCIKDNEAINEISKRLLYLAYKSGRENWEEIYAGYKDRLYKADISKCESIIYSYNENIVTDLEIYSEDSSALWYVDSWKGPMFIEVLDWIMKKIEVKGAFDQNFLRKLFLHPFVDIIKQQEGGSLPTKLLTYLNETDKEGINVDENVNAERFTENINEINSLPEEFKQKIEIDSDIPYNQDVNGFNPIEEEGYLETQAESKDNHSIERKRRSDFGGSHQKHEPSVNVAASDKSKKENHNSIDIEAEETSVEEEVKSLKERLSHKWEIQKNMSVEKPRPYKNSASSEGVFNQQKTPITKSAEDFFDSDINTDRRNNPTSRNGIGNYSDKYKAAQQEVEKIRDQESLEMLFQETPKYTFLWFKYLIEMLIEEKSSSASTHSIQVDFKNAMVMDKCTLSFVGPNRVIPKWIEYADNIEVHILNGNVRKKIEADLQFFTEDGIWLYTNQAEELIDFINSADKIRMVASGKSANHDDSLVKQFIKLGYEDDFNLKENLPESIRFIYGPPGTGKTTTLVKNIEEIVVSNDSALDILVLTPTNKAADVIAKRLIDNSNTANYTYRYGITDSIEYLQENPVYTRNDNFITEEGHHIVVTTAARYPYDYFMPNEEIICDHSWDYIIVDEASMIDIVTMAFILHKGYNSNFIISGDPKQIQPVPKNEIHPENIYHMVELNSFAAAQNRPNVEALKVQYRSIPSIGKLVSDYSYDGIVTANRNEADRKPLDIGMKISSINFVGFRTELLDNLYGLDAIEGSAFNLYSAIFAYEYASHIAMKIKQQYSGSPYSIGIVCPYKKQSDAIRQMLELRDISNEMCKVSCGTVHSFQGDECDIMIVVLNPPINVGINSHINNQNIINVAMSRAKDYIFFIVPDDKTHGFFTREVLGKLAENKSILYCSDIEEIMFNNKEFIKNNTNVSCHTPVNVFYDSTSLYEVKKDDTAVDIQINEHLRNI